VIVRILGEGRYDVPDAAMGEIDRRDAELAAALDADDEAAFGPALGALVDAVRSSGTLIPSDDLQPSTRVVPHPGSTLDEVRDLLAEDA
jgi:hypothetical protein